MFKFILKFLPLIIHEVADIIKEKSRERKVQKEFEKSLKK